MGNIYSKPENWAADDCHPQPHRQIIQGWRPAVHSELDIYSPQPKGDYLVTSKIIKGKYIYQKLTGTDWEPLMRDVAEKLQLILLKDETLGDDGYYLLDKNIGKRLGLDFVDSNGFFIAQWRVDIDVAKRTFTDEITWGHPNKEMVNYKSTHSWKVY